MDSSLIDSVIEYRKRLEKGVGVDKTLHILRKLERIPFSVEMLKETGIGKVVRKISKENDGDVRDKAKHLYSEWRRMVREMPDSEVDMKLSEIQAPKKVKIERDESPSKVNKYENAIANGGKSSGCYDPEMNWHMKSGSKPMPVPLPKLAAGSSEKSGNKPERRLPTVNEVKEAQRVNGSRTVTNGNKDNAMLGVTSRKVRTTVYSGQARSTQYTHVLRLEDLCLRVLMDHIDKIQHVGCVPYYLIKPVLKKCTPTQLFRLEDYNPAFVEEDDELWFEHCQSTFRDKEPEEHESWRELYIRCEYERDARLKQISGKINRSQEQAGPARSTLLFETAIVKAPRHVQRLQKKLGTAAAIHFPEPGSTGKVNAAAMRAAARESTSKASNPAKKAKTAPLMAKSIQLMKTRFRR